MNDPGNPENPEDRHTKMVQIKGQTESSSTHPSAIYQHLRGEAIIFKEVSPKLVPLIVFGIYIFLIIFRRTSFYMEGFGLDAGSLKSGPLYDVGSHTIMALFGLPDMSVPDPDPEVEEARIHRIEAIIGWTDKYMMTTSLLLFAPSIASWYSAYKYGRMPKKPVYLGNYFNRYVIVLIVGHFLRFLSYIFTVVPGPSYHCRPDFVQPDTGVTYMGLLPTTIHSIAFPSATDLASINLNCGDLVFSGHMFTNVLSYYYFAVYSRQIFIKEGLLSAEARNVLLAVNTFCLCGCAVCILASRQHYTVDLIIATYIGFLLPYWFDQKWPLKDIDPYADEQAVQIKEEIETILAEISYGDFERAEELRGLQDALDEKRHIVETGETSRRGSGGRSSGDRGGEDDEVSPPPHSNRPKREESDSVQVAMERVAMERRAMEMEMVATERAPAARARPPRVPVTDGSDEQWHPVTFGQQVTLTNPLRGPDCV
jgi:hypothetical protein